MSNASPSLEESAAASVPARSGTPAAWAALLLLALLLCSWSLRTQLLCAAIRHLAPVIAWKHGHSLSIGGVVRKADGTFVANGIEWATGRVPHRSTLRCEEATVRFRPLATFLWPQTSRTEDPWIRSLGITKAKLLVDLRDEDAESAFKGSPVGDGPGFFRRLLPGSLSVVSSDLVVIGESGRLAVRGLVLDLPAGWPGSLSFSAAEAELGEGHGVVPGNTTPARWEPGFLRLGPLPLGKGLVLEELAVRLVRDGVEFGLSGKIGKGLLRADGSLGGVVPLEVTVVGERLALDALRWIVADAAEASGTIDQARLTFRGDAAKPMEADASLRLVGRNFRWQGRGWESLRLAASMTGRNLTVSECSLLQGDNELRASGRSSLPAHWRAMLRAPFTAEFQASLPDAGVLASLFGTGFWVTGGSLYLDGMVRGADNRAEGYCNFSGLGTRIRRLPLDWMRGCLLFEGGTTRIAHAEARASGDSVSLWGSAANSVPHAYEGAAEIRVEDLASRLEQLGCSVPPDLGAGSVSGSWRGGGDASRHWGSFEGQVNEWVSRRSRTGVSGTFAGSYEPGKFLIDRAQIVQGDMNLAFGMTAGVAGLEVKGVTLRKEGEQHPVANGEIRLPLDMTGLLRGEDVWKTLSLDRPVAASLTFDRLDLGRLTDLLGQSARLGGRVSGSITVGGTAASPDLSADLRAEGFSVTGLRAGDIVFSSSRQTNGTRLLLDQRIAGEHPLHAEGLLKLVFSKTGGIPSLSADAPLSGKAECHRAVIDPWIRLLGGWEMFHPVSAVAEGTVAVTGTAWKPQVSGDLRLKAAEARAAGVLNLAGCDLQMSFSGAKLSATNGSATFRGTSVSLSGDADWTSGCRASLRMKGDALPFELVPGVTGPGRADVVWKSDGSPCGVLAGQLELQPLAVDTMASLTPVFCPPGFTRESPAKAGQDSARLDLSLRTIPVPVQEKPCIAADLHFVGNLAQPIASGTVTLRNQTLRLPSGIRRMPEATVICEGGVTRVSGAAWGMTRKGLETMLVGGTLANPRIVPLSASLSFASAVYASLMTDTSSVAVPQASFWLRQEMLFPSPSAPWAYPRGEPSVEGLGFHGVPWSVNLSLGKHAAFRSP